MSVRDEHTCNTLVFCAQAVHFVDAGRFRTSSMYHFLEDLDTSGFSTPDAETRRLVADVGVAALRGGPVPPRDVIKRGE